MMTVSDLLRMLGPDSPHKPDTLIFVHVAAADGWAIAPLKGQVGRTADGSMTLLAVDLPEQLEDYADGEETS